MQVFKKFPAFMEHESSSPYPQVPATRSYPEPTINSELLRNFTKVTCHLCPPQITLLLGRRLVQKFKGVNRVWTSFAFYLNSFRAAAHIPTKIYAYFHKEHQLLIFICKYIFSKSVILNINNRVKQTTCCR